MGVFGIGQPVRRKEDERFIRGNGCYHDDLAEDGHSHVVFVRSSHAHAKIVSVNSDVAKALPGVIAVWTAVDLKEFDLTGFPCLASIWIPLERGDGKPAAYPHNPLLAEGRVRHVGEAVAMIVAETLKVAEEAAELFEIVYEELNVVVETDKATLSDVPQIHDDVPENKSFVWNHGDRKATNSAFSSASHVTSISLVNNRVAVMPIEPRGAIGEYDTKEGKYTLITNAQHIYDTQLVVSQVLKVDREAIRVVAKDLGGGFGVKYVSYPEQALVLVAAKHLGLIIRWTSNRGEAFLSDTQARDHYSNAELALDDNGKFLGLRVETKANLGAYASNLGPVCPSILYTRMLSCAYRIPCIHAEVTGVYTNTVFTDAYRGAGQPEAIYLVERLVDKAAREMKISPDEIRRRNFILPDEMPYTTPVEITYDSGNYPDVLDRCLALSNWLEFPNRRNNALKEGRYRGIGLSMYVEATTGDPLEEANLHFSESGRLEVWLGTKSSGQGHETTYAQFLNELLSVPFDKIDVMEGDTKEVAIGGGTGGSRSIYMAGMALKDGAEKVIKKCLEIAAVMLEASVKDIRFDEGEFRIIGTDRRVDIMAVAQASYDLSDLPGDVTPGLDTNGRYDFSGETVPNGCHIAEVEVDPETGKVHIVDYFSVSDFGRVVNPLLLEAQVQGGVAQGLGQALMEEVRYDSNSGQLLTGSFMDYCMPRADDLPFFMSEATDIPCPTNELGVKGCGEAGTIAACATFINAVIDALADFNVRHVDMPASSEKIWQAINNSKDN